MDRDDWDLRPDAVERALDAFLPRSGGQVMREAFHGVARFDDFVRHTGLTPAAVSARLKDLVADDMLARVGYQEPGERGRHEYHLTDKSRDLLPTVIALMRWSDRWLPAPHGPTLSIVHRDCGADVDLEMTCGAGHRIAGIDELGSRPGAGARYVGADGGDVVGE